MAARKKAKSTRRRVADRRREEHAELARRDILVAAAEAFVEHGYQAATVQDIADRAGFNPASLYTYFEGKKAIFTALIDAVVADFSSALLEPVDSESDFAARLEKMVVAVLEAAERNRHVVAYFMRLQEYGGSRPASTLRPIGTVKQVQDWFDRHATPDDLGGFTSMEAATVFMTVLGGFFRVWTLGEESAPWAAQSTRLTRFLVYGFRAASSAQE